MLFLRKKYIYVWHKYLSDLVPNLWNEQLFKHSSVCNNTQHSSRRIVVNNAQRQVRSEFFQNTFNSLFTLEKYSIRLGASFVQTLSHREPLPLHFPCFMMQQQCAAMEEDCWGSRQNSWNIFCMESLQTLNRKPRINYEVEIKERIRSLWNVLLSLGRRMR